MARADSKLSLCGKWLFHKGDFEYRRNLSLSEVQAMCKSGGALSGFDGFDEQDNWRVVSVPHDALCDEEIDTSEDSSGGYKKRICCWYKKSFAVTDMDFDYAELTFDGVLGKCEVYLNGVLATRNFSGYNSFSCDVSAYIVRGENTIAIYVDPRRPEGWWYEGVGIYRPARIVFKNNSRIVDDECFVRCSLAGGEWRAEADLVIKNPENAIVSAALKDKNGKLISSFSCKAEEKISINLCAKNPKLWSPESPERYLFVAELINDNSEIDKFNCTVGFRTVEWNAERGMLLNGNPYLINGICSHQDHAGVGAATTPEIEEFRIIKLKELGVNAYRCVHHAPSKTLLEICDRLGMLVMVENRHFSTSSEVLSQLENLVKTSRNHPSVFLYCLFNEEPWQKDEIGYKIACVLKETVKALDPTRAVLGSQNHGLLNEKNASDALDVIGVNYALAQYEEIHKRTPDKVILGTENSPTYATRSVAVNDKNKQVFADDGENYPQTFSEPLFESLDIFQSNSYVAGGFVFCGFDYRGEPHPYGYPSVASHWGILDSCGFEKNISHLLKCWYKKELFLKLCVSHNGNDAKIIVFTNGERVELFSGGKFIGEMKPLHNKAEWSVPVADEFIAIAKRGSESMQDSYKMPGEFYSLATEDVTQGSTARGARIVNIKAIDQNGCIVCDFNKKINVSLAKGRILGVGNGDPNGHFSCRAEEFPLFGGLGQIILSPDYEGLSVTIKN